MPVKVIMPPGGQTADESLLVKWHKKMGEAVLKGEALFEIETDKATLEIESHSEGTILAILHDEGEFVPAGDVVALIGMPGEHTTVGESSVSLVAVDDAVIEKGRDPTGLIQASPAAKKLAAENGIPLERLFTIGGTPIKKADVENYLASSGGKLISATDYDLVDMTPMRKTIAGHLSETAAIVPQFSIAIDIDMTEIIKLRSIINERQKNQGIRVAFNDMIMKSALRAIEKYPILNSSGTVTLANLGPGVNWFTAIINPPENCILAVGDVEERPVALNGQVVVKRMMTLTASFDHRKIDGAVGALFMNELRKQLENPNDLI